MSEKDQSAAGAVATTNEVPLTERVQEIICEQLSVKPEEVVPDATFTGDLGADSLDMVELTMALEEEFGIDISEEQAERIQTVGDSIRFIEQRTSSQD